jgi:hypothetical protein
VCQQRMRLLSTECKSLVKAADEAARVAEYGVDKAAIHATMAKLASRLKNLEDVLGKVRLTPFVPVPHHSCFLMRGGDRIAPALPEHVPMHARNPPAPLRHCC